MEDIGMNNFIAIVAGIFLILLCCIISYFFQKCLFRKYKNKVKNIADDRDDKSMY